QERIEGQLRPINQLLLFSGLAGLGRSHPEQSNDDDADQTGCRPPPRSASTRHKSMRAVALVGHFRFLPPSSAEHIVRFMTGADLSQRHPHTRAHYGTLIKTLKNYTAIRHHLPF